jgi:hypothetical protein
LTETASPTRSAVGDQHHQQFTTALFQGSCATLKQAIMSLTEVIIRLALVAVLVTFLFFKHWLRERERIGPSNPAEWTGKGIDVAPIRPTIDEVRRTYARPTAKGLCFHRSLLALARRAAAHLAYFQEREPEQSNEKHAQ